jgi:hypothetical protein
MLPLPPLLAVTLGVLGAAVVVRQLLREWRRVSDLEKSKDAPLAGSKSEAIPTLRRHPDGTYRP